MRSTTPPDAADFRPRMLAHLESVFDHDGAREMIDAIAKDVPRREEEFERALIAGDAQRVERVLHTIKSSALLSGAEALGQDLNAAEQRLRDGTPPGEAEAALMRRYAAFVRALCVAAAG